MRLFGNLWRPEGHSGAPRGQPPRARRGQRSEHSFRRRLAECGAVLRPRDTVRGRSRDAAARGAWRARPGTRPVPAEPVTGPSRWLPAAGSAALRGSASRDCVLFFSLNGCVTWGWGSGVSGPQHQEHPREECGEEPGARGQELRGRALRRRIPASHPGSGPKRCRLERRWAGVSAVGSSLCGAGGEQSSSSSLLGKRRKAGSCEWQMRWDLLGPASSPRRNLHECRKGCTPGRGGRSGPPSAGLGAGPEP